MGRAEYESNELSGTQPLDQTRVSPRLAQLTRRRSGVREVFDQLGGRGDQRFGFVRRVVNSQLGPVTPAAEVAGMGQGGGGGIPSNGNDGKAFIERVNPGGQQGAVGMGVGLSAHDE